MELKIQTTKTYRDIESGRKIILLRGGTRSSKSYTAIQWLIVQALSNENIMVSVVRKSFPSLRISALRDFRSIMEGLGIWDEYRWLGTEHCYTFENGSQIEFMSIDNAEKRKGTKRDYLFIDEANELEYNDFFQLFIRTTTKTILAYNPSFSKLHWIYTQLATHPEADEFVSTYKDNPFLDESLVTEIERLKNISPSYYQIYGLGDFGATEGLVFDNTTIIDKLPDDAELICYGIDFGFTNDPTAMVGLFKWNGEIVLHELLYKKGMLSGDIARHIQQIYESYGKAQVIADSADPRLIDEIFRYGVNIKKVVKPTIEYSIELMKKQRLNLTKQSANMINEFYGYVYMKDKNGNNTNQPVDYNNHIIDASRYAAINHLSLRSANRGKYSISII